MRRLSFLMLLVAVVVSAVAAIAQDDKPWFDLKNCEFCKQFANPPDMLLHINTEYYSTAVGLMMITNIDKGYEEHFMKAQEGMQKVVADMQAGKMPTMCQHCSKYGEFTMAGVKMDVVKTPHGTVSLLVASDPAMIEKLHAFGKRTADETEKFKAAAKAEEKKK